MIVVLIGWKERSRPGSSAMHAQYQSTAVARLSSVNPHLIQCITVRQHIGGMLRVFAIAPMPMCPGASSPAAPRRAN
jgi:hypothetical protein